MKFLSKYRSVLLAGTAITLIAACTGGDDDDIVSPGDTTPVVIEVGEPTVDPAATAFALRATAPASQAACPEGTVFVSDVDLLDTGSETTYCALAPRTGGTITASVDIPFSADPILISGTVLIGDENNQVDVSFAEGQAFISEGAEGIVDLLVVSRGSTLTAKGSATNPIIFTSVQDYLDDLQPNGTSGTGEWGGLAINGAAPLNECTVNTDAVPGAADCEQLGEGGSGVFGGDQAGDSSGEFEFIRVQHAGFLFAADNELNGVALQGVGSGTLFRNIQVHSAADDGFEWFGGTVNVSNLIVTGANDDSFDWTDGWVGSGQFLLAVQNPGDDNGIEGDNNGLDGGSLIDAEPRSNPFLSNITLIGDGASGEGIELRDGSDGNIANVIVTNFAEALEFDDDSALVPPVQPELNATLLAGNVENFSSEGEALFNAGIGNVTDENATLQGVLPGPIELAANTNAILATDIDPSFEPVTFLGAFGPDDTAEDNFTTGWTIAIPGAPDPSCPEGTSVEAFDSPADFPGRSEALTCSIDSPVVGDVTLTAGNLYRIDGTVFVGEDLGADPLNPAPDGQEGTLIVDPGVTLFGNQAAGIVDLLVVSRGSQIDVNGSQFAPVVLTSREDLDNGGVVRAATGEIGGLAINGRSALNECTVDSDAIPGSVDCTQLGEGGSGEFGGATPDDNSGSIKFMQIRYAGFLFAADNELNGIALQGVGSETELDFIQILNAADDGIEWFGGTVSASHIVITGAEDDSIDWTDGWTGTLQYAIVRQNAGDDNGIEGDNNGLDGGSLIDALPRSRPVVTNLTLIGGGPDASSEGVLFRDGSDGVILNSIVTGFGEGLEFDDDSALGIAPTYDSLSVSNSGFDDDGVSAALVGIEAPLDFDDIQVADANTLGAIPGFTTPLAPGAAENTPTAEDPQLVCADEFANIPAAEVDDGSAPFTALPSPCAELDNTDTLFGNDGIFIGALEDENDLWFAGWTIGL